MDASRARYGVVVHGPRGRGCCVLVAPVPKREARWYEGPAWRVVSIMSDGRVYHEVATFGPQNKWEEQQ